VPQPPSSIVGLPDLSLVGNVSFGAFGRVDALTVLLLLFTLVLANFVDAMGTMTGLGRQAGLADKDGRLPGIGKAGQRGHRALRGDRQGPDRASADVGRGGGVRGILRRRTDPFVAVS
jgi:hypothetical protein